MTQQATLLSLIVMATSMAQLCAAEVDVVFSADKTYVGVPVKIEVIVKNAEDHQPPEWPPLNNAKLSNLGRSDQSYVSITSAGRVQRTTATYTYNVTPTEKGILSIPAITVVADNRRFQTTPKRIVVEESRNEGFLFVEIIADQESVYVGEPIDATLEIALRSVDNRQYKLSADDMWRTIDLRNSDWGPFVNNVNTRRPNVTYRIESRQDESGIPTKYFVYSLKQRVWPERPGRYTAGDVIILVNYPLRMRRNPFSLIGPEYEVVNSRPVSASIEESSIIVKSPPEENRPRGFRGAVGKYEMTVTAAPAQVSVGDPITLNIDIRGTGRLELLRAPLLWQQETLAQDFRIPAEELAGIVNDTRGVKRFSQSIRAKHDQITQIPPVEFTYFDPGDEQFVTIKSDPIPLTVSESSRMAVSQIVEGEPLQGSRTELTRLESGLLANYDDIDIILARRTVSIGGETWAFLGGCPVVYALCLVLGRYRNRLVNDQGFARRRTAQRNALSTLKRAGEQSNGPAAVHVASAITGYVADRCNLPPGGMTRVDAMQRLRNGSVPDELITQVDTLLIECEGAQYGGSGTSTDASLVERASQYVKQLERYGIS